MYYFSLISDHLIFAFQRFLTRSRISKSKLEIENRYTFLKNKNLKEEVEKTIQKSDFQILIEFRVRVSILSFDLEFRFRVSNSSFDFELVSYHR